MADAPTELFLVRHGEADSNRDGRFGGWSDAPLTELGQRQAAAAAAELVARKPTAVIASDLPRAAQTAAPIAAALGLEVRSLPGLRERTLGVFDGLAFAEVEARYPELWRRMRARDPDAIPEGGEAPATVYARVTAALETICADYAGQRVAVVSHGLALYHAFAHICGLGVPGPTTPVFVLVDNASITHVERRPERWRIVSLNDTAHLRGL